MPNRKPKAAGTRLYTWEEVSWMTGLSINELLEMFGQAQQNGIAYDTLTPQIDSPTLDGLANGIPPAATKLIN